MNLKFESLRRFKFQSFTAGDSDAGPPPPTAGPDGVPEHEVQARERLKFKRGPATEPEVPVYRGIPLLMRTLLACASKTFAD